MPITVASKSDDKPRLKIYTVLFAEDVPHYGSIEIEAESNEEAVRVAGSRDTGDICSEAAWDSTVCKRIVHVEDSENNLVAADIPLDDFVLFNKRTSGCPAESEYTIGINNDDGDCYDIALLQRNEPIATLLAPETQLYPLVQAGNCFFPLLAALEDMVRCVGGEYPVTDQERDEARRNALEVIRKATGESNV